MSEYDYSDGEERNYDDFMMSDDDQMDVIEMEDDSDEENVVKEIKGNTSCVNLESSVEPPVNYKFEEQYLLGKSLKEEGKFEEAVGTFMALIDTNETANETDTTWQLKCYKQCLKSLSIDIHYNGICPIKTNKIVKYCDLFFCFVIDNNKKLDHDYLQKSLANILEILVPRISRHFIFDIEFLDIQKTLQRVHLNMSMLSKFKSLKREVPGIWEEVLDTVLVIKEFAATIWQEKLTTGNVLSENFKGEIWYVDAHDLDTKVMVDAVDIYFQYFVNEYMESGDFRNKGKLSVYLGIVKNLKDKSLAVSQKSDIMLLYHMLNAILLVLYGACTDVNCNEEFVHFFENMKQCRNEFWQCLQRFEELGISTRNYTRPFQRLILSGFVFSNMLLYDEEEEKINPFELEQFKIVNDSADIMQLQEIYGNFVNLNLFGLCTAMNKLAYVQRLWKPLIDKTYHIAMVSTLWKKIASAYSCISIEDIREKLRTSSTNVITRDELLGILMKSLMKGDRDALFKLDLTADLVYFGEENQLKLTCYSKNSFVRDFYFGKNNSMSLEFANNIGIYDSHFEFDAKKVKTKRDFFGQLKRLREGVRDNLTQSEIFQTDRVSYGGNYYELVELSASALQGPRN